MTTHTPRAQSAVAATAHESEAGFQRAVIELAQTLGWQHIWHDYDSRRTHPGLPDLLMVRVPTEDGADRDGRLIAAAGQIAALAYDDPDADESAAAAADLVYAATAREHRASSVSLAEAIDAHLEDVLAIADGQVVGVETGFPELDRLTGGFYPGELVLVCARPGVGKSTLAVQIALAKADDLNARGASGTVEYVTLEMPARAQAKRLLTSLSGIDGRLVRRGFRAPGQGGESFDSEAWARYDDAAQEARVRLGQRIWLRDRSVRLAELRTHLTLAVRTRGCCCAIIDYVGLVYGDNPRATDYSRMSEIAREMKQIARDLNIVVVALCQFNRASEGRDNHRPRIADIRDTGEWEQSADFMLGLHRPSMYDPDRAAQDAPFAALTEVLVLKARDSRPNVWVPLWFKPALTRLEPWPVGVPVPEDEGQSEATRVGAAAANGGEEYATW